MVAFDCATVDLDGREVEVRGLSLSDLMRLAGRFPLVAEMLAGGAIDPMQLLVLEPDCGPAVCVLATGDDGAGGWPSWAQAKVYASAMELTFPFGVGAVVNDLAGIVGGADSSTT